MFVILLDFVQIIPVRFFARMNSGMFAQIAESGEELETSRFQTIKRGAVVHSLVRFQAIESGERPLTADNAAFVGPIFGVDSDVNLQADFFLHVSND